MKDLHLLPREVVGFFVGEGSFSVESGRDEKYLLGWRIRPFVSVAIKKDDEEILHAIKNLLGCGHIYELDFGRYRKYKDRGWKPQVRFKVTNISDLANKVVPFFERNSPFGTKAKAFAIFSKIVKMKYDKKDREERSLSEMKKLASQLQLINKRGL